MEWQSETKETWMPDTIRARYKVYEAYSESYINWKVFSQALEMIERKKNGTWMFETTHEARR